MRILVYGAGVQGCELAHRLLQNKKNVVTMLARGEWKERLDQRGLVIRHWAQCRTTVDRVATIDTLAPDDCYDLVFVTLQAGQLPDVLPILKQNRSEYFVFVGNDPHAVEVMQAMQRPADKIAFGFQSSGGHRDVDKVVSAHVGVGMTIGGATAPLSGVFRYRVKTAFEGAKYKLTFVSDMDGWLKCHLALILPACYLCYACSGDLSKATKEQRDLVLDAAWEACEMLKAAHIPVDDKENTDCYRAGTPGRRKMDAMVLALCKTPLGRLCVSDHAMHAVAEMQYLDEAFEGLRARTSVRMTAWDTLRSQMPRGTSCGKRRRKQSDKCMEKEADASLPLFPYKGLSLWGQRRRPPPAAETGRSCWGRGQQGCERQRSRRWEPQPGMGAERLRGQGC